ncbi:HAD-like protein [Ophiocordyceps sinensis CO18]|nr:HAD-like protein [Ophiocordyceps sinensis CO18]
MSQSDCHDSISQQLALGPGELAELLQHHEPRFDARLYSALRELRRGPDAIRLVATANMPAPEYQRVRERWPRGFWGVWDAVFASSLVGMRKPSLCYYRHVLARTRAAPGDTLFVEASREAAIAARSLGFRAALAKDGGDAARIVKNAMGDPVARGRGFLLENAQRLYSMAENGVQVVDCYSSLLILEATRDRSLVALRHQDTKRRWNFYSGAPVLTTESFPDDLDTTSLAFLNLEHDEATVRATMDDMLACCDQDGIVMTYFDKSRPRVDPVVAACVLTLFHSRNRGHELVRTYTWLRDILRHRAYVDGTLYYDSAEWFLYHINRLISRSADADAKRELGDMLKERVEERIGAPGDALSLSMRLVVCASMGVPDRRDLQTLLSVQEEDGGWEPSRLCGFPRLNLWLGNRGVTTAIAVNAIEAMRGLLAAAS